MSNLTVKYFKNFLQKVFLQTKLFTIEKMPAKNLALTSASKVYYLAFYQI
jgi:hypothetical protein